MYSSREDFDKVINNDDLAALTGEQGDESLFAAIESADSIIDGYLSSVCTVLPLVNVPPVIRQLSIDIGLYNLHTRVQFKDIPEWVSKKYDNAIKMLRSISKGELILPGIIPEERLSKIIIGSDEKRTFK